jgi:thioredoxin 1
MRTKTIMVAMLGLMLLTVSCGAKTGKAKAASVVQTKMEKKEMNVTELTLEGFKANIMDYESNPKEWNYKGERPAVIDFYAVWCGPCKATAPILESLAGEYAGKVDFYKVDVDKQQELAAMFGIRSIPSLLFIPKEGQPQMQVGAMMRPDLENAIKSIMVK